MSELIYRRHCPHKGMFIDGGPYPLDGLKAHPIGVVTGYNRGGGRTYESHCPGGTDLVLDPDKVLITNPDEFHFIEAKDVLDVLDREAE